MAIGLDRAAWRWVASARLELRAQVVEAAHSRRDRLACADLAARALRVAARHGQGRHLPAADARQAQAEHRKLSVRHSRVSRRTDRPRRLKHHLKLVGRHDPVTGVPRFPLPGVLCCAPETETGAQTIVAIFCSKGTRVNCGQQTLHTISCVLASPPLIQCHPRPRPRAPALAVAPALCDDGPLSGSSGRSCRRRRGRRSSCRPAW